MHKSALERKLKKSWDTVDFRWFQYTGVIEKKICTENHERNLQTYGGCTTKKIFEKNLGEVVRKQYKGHTKSQRGSEENLHKKL